MAPNTANSIASVGRAQIAGIATLANGDRMHELEKLLDELQGRPNLKAVG